MEAQKNLAALYISFYFYWSQYFSVLSCCQAGFLLFKCCSYSLFHIRYTILLPTSFCGLEGQIAIKSSSTVLLKALVSVLYPAIPSTQYVSSATLSHFLDVVLRRKVPSSPNRNLYHFQWHKVNFRSI